MEAGQSARPGRRGADIQEAKKVFQRDYRYYIELNGSFCQPKSIFGRGRKVKDKTLNDLMERSFDGNRDKVAVRTLQPAAGKEGELSYQPITYGELKERRDRLAAGFTAVGLGKEQRVGILTDGGLEPLLVFLGADLCGMSSVPLCTKSPPEILIHSINHSALECLVVDEVGYEQYARVRDQVRRAPRLVLTEGSREGILGWAELMDMGEAPPQVEVAPDDESKILYTSGSSGLPKGVVQTHANIVANVEEVWDLLSEREPMRFFKSAPDYHSMGILNIYYPLAKGWILDMARSPDRVLSDIRRSEPEGFLTVPLVLDKVFGNVRKEIDAGGLKGKLIARSVAAKQSLARGQAGWPDRLFHAALGQRIIAKVHSQLAQRVGPHLELLIVGSAKADPEALDFFHEVLDITTFEGYGVTECAPLIATNHLGGRKTGTVGRPFLEVKLLDEDDAEVGRGDPRSGSYCGSGEQVGELWVHGPNVMKGYLNDPEQTAKVLVEDEEDKKLWYRTGDLFSMDDDGFLTFRGRVGRQFKLRNGEFVNPELLERIFARVGLVEHVVVCGDQSRTFPLPLVSLDPEEAKKHAAAAGLAPDDEDALRRHPVLAERVRQLFLAEARAAGLPGYLRPRKVALLPEPLSEEKGTLTRGLKKIVPGVLVQSYAELIEQTYAE